MRGTDDAADEDGMRAGLDDVVNDAIEIGDRHRPKPATGSRGSSIRPSENQKAGHCWAARQGCWQARSARRSSVDAEDAVLADGGHRRAAAVDAGQQQGRFGETEVMALTVTPVLPPGPSDVTRLTAAACTRIMQQKRLHQRSISCTLLSTLAVAINPILPKAIRQHIGSWATVCRRGKVFEINW